MPKFFKKPTLRGTYVWFALTAAILALWVIANSNQGYKQTNLREIVQATQDKKVVNGTIKHSTSTPGWVEVRAVCVIPKGGETSIMADGKLTERDLSVLQDSGKFSEKLESSWGGTVIFSLLPLGIMLVFLFMLMNSQSGKQGVMGFGKSKAKLFQRTAGTTKFSDVAGCDEAKEDVAEIVEFLRNPERFRKLGAKIPKGLLLMGPPGCGKTLLARAIAGESESAFLSLSGSDFQEMFVGVGASVTGDTPVLVKTQNGAKLLPIQDVIDPHYTAGEADKVKYVTGLSTLGFEPLKSGFYGSKSKTKHMFGGSKWSTVKGVLRHKVNEIYTINYLGGSIRTTGDHSIFVRDGNMIVAKKASDLKKGDVLVDIPFNVRSTFIPGIGTTHKVKAHNYSDALVEPRYLDLYETEYDSVQSKYAYALEQKDVKSQAELGEELGVSQATIGNWQSGVHNPQFLNNNLIQAGTPKKIQISTDLMRLLGYYTAEGRTTRYATALVFNINETHLHADVVDLFKKIFNINAHIRHRPETASTCITVSSPIIADFFKTHTGTGAHEKHIPEFIWNLPKPYYLAYLQGYSEGDGCTGDDGKLSMTSVSRQLILELAWLGSMHGIKAGIGEGIIPAGRMIRGKPLPETHYWKLIIGKTSHPFGIAAQYPNQFKRPIITEIIKQPYEGFVYDFCGCNEEAFFGGEKPLLLHNSRVRDLFDQAKKFPTSTIFIDEIDSIGRHRGMGISGANEEREQTLNALLSEMDGFTGSENIIVIAATNRPDILDSALTRPGRFDRKVQVDLPDLRGREAVLKVHASRFRLDADVDLTQLARITPGMSGADLSNLLNEAALGAGRDQKGCVNWSYILAARDKVMYGQERKRLMDDADKKIVAYHEAGHALVQAFLDDGSAPIHKVTIIPRGASLGSTMFAPTKDKLNHGKKSLLRQLATLYGGRIAEEEVLGDISSGAAGDIQQATRIAQHMVCDWGMSSLGPIMLESRGEVPGERAAHQYSQETALEIDKAVQVMLKEQYDVAREIINSHRDMLEKIAQALLVSETIDGAMVMDIIGRGKTHPGPDTPGTGAA